MTVDSRTLDRSQLQAKVLPELQQIAESLGVTSHQRLKKGDLIDAIIAKMPTDGQDTAASGNGEPKTMERRREEQVGEEGQQASAETARPDGGDRRAGVASRYPLLRQRAAVWLRHVGGAAWRRACRQTASRGRGCDEGGTAA